MLPVGQKPEAPLIRIYAIAACCIALAALGVTWVMTRADAKGTFAECSAGAVAGDAAIGGPFELVDMTGAPVTDKDVLTRPALIYFGYTFCPDVCPLDTVRNADAVDLLAARGFDVRPVFITVDPKRDTPEVLREFAAYIHDDLLGLTGSPEQIEAVSKAYRTYYNRQETDDEFYLVDHSTLTYLVLPEHGFVDFFRRDASAEAVADVAQCYLERV